MSAKKQTTKKKTPKLNTPRVGAPDAPKPNADGGYLPWAWDGARRIESEREEYLVRQQLHRERFPDYASGWRRPSETTTARVWKLVGEAATQIVSDLLAIERDALVIALDGAIQAGQDKRLFTHNLIFDAVAAAYSDWYRAARERGPARVSWEMAPETLKFAWRDLLRNRIYLDKLIPVIYDGFDLYKVTKARDDGHADRYTVDLNGGSEHLRDQFLTAIAEDGATGGTYRRRSSLRRLRLACEPETEDPIVDEPQQDEDAGTDFDEEAAGATTQKVVAGVAYNIATPGERSLDVIRTLEGARLFVNAKAVEAEYDRLRDLAESAFLEAREKYGVDLTKSTAKTPRTVIDAGTGKPRPGFYRSAWQRHLVKVLGRRPDRAKLSAVVTLGKKYAKFMGQALQLEAVMKRLLDFEAVLLLDKHGEIEICTRYAKAVNRRYQAFDFWFSETSGKDQQSERVNLGSADLTVTKNRRGRLFRAGASTTAGELGFDLIGPRQEFIGVDVSGSQVQIFAVLLGLRQLEDKLRTESYKDIAAKRLWERHNDPRDSFTLPEGHDYADGSDSRLKEAAKSATMTWMYGSPPSKVVERLAESPDDFGAGLGAASNLLRFLRDDELQLDQIEARWKKACNRIAQRAWREDRYAGIVFTDPFDGAHVRWNPIRWETQPITGVDNIRIRAKVPLDVRFEMVEKPAVSKKGKAFIRRYWQPVWEPAKADQRLGPAGFPGDFPVDRHKLATSFSPMFVHVLDSAFCGIVVEELKKLGVETIVAVHDAFYVPFDAVRKLEKAVKAASQKWFLLLGMPGGVYDELERPLDKCMPPTRGKKAGKCCGHCARWICELRAIWKRRVEKEDWPEFKVGPNLTTEIEGFPSPLKCDKSAEQGNEADVEPDFP